MSKTHNRLMMILFGGKGKPDAAEEKREAKAGKPHNKKEELLEDSKGRPITLRSKTSKKG